MNNQLNIGDRIILAAPGISDRSEFLKKVRNSHNIHFPWVSPPTNVEQFNAYLDKINQKNQYGFFLKLIETQKIIGVININDVVRGCFQSGYLGFYVFRNYQGQGFMSEGLHKVIQQAFSELDLHRLEANIQTENRSPIALVKRAKFKYEGFSKRYLFINNVWRDHERFALTKEDFLN